MEKANKILKKGLIKTNFISSSESENTYKAGIPQEAIKMAYDEGKNLMVNIIDSKYLKSKTDREIELMNREASQRARAISNELYKRKNPELMNLYNRLDKYLKDLGFVQSENHPDDPRYTQWKNLLVFNCPHKCSSVIVKVTEEDGTEGGSYSLGGPIRALQTRFNAMMPFPEGTEDRLYSILSTQIGLIQQMH